jgi:methylaspartate mutase epsilon subunit
VTDLVTHPAVPDFGAFVELQQARGTLVVQPRMGMSNPAEMRHGLLAARSAKGITVGTITLDSYTRVGNLDAAGHAVRLGLPLNGYPILSHPAATTAAMVADVADAAFPIQVRHGSADPRAIFARMLEVGLSASEGGPISYCLPYSRTALKSAVPAWAEACELLAGIQSPNREPHLETFGGCMLGQLCPPSLLVAISVLEALFFQQHGIRSVSLSYAQQSNYDQDLDAIAALARLANEFLPFRRWHIVIYTYMGVFPRTERGARNLSAAAARLAAEAGAARLVVKTAAEAHRIPTIAENVAALNEAAAVASSVGEARLEQSRNGGNTYAEARSLIEATLETASSLDSALVEGFRRGILDVPYCLHPDNRGRTRSYVAADGSLWWDEVGNMPVAPARSGRGTKMTSAGLIDALTFVASRHDSAPEVSRPLSHSADKKLRPTGNVSSRTPCEG